MRLLAATTILALLIAATASVFAIWPVVADAPWEDTTVPVVEDRTDEIRCEGALSYRDEIVGSNRSFAEVQRLLPDAENEIRRYCR